MSVSVYCKVYIVMQVQDEEEEEQRDGDAEMIAEGNIAVQIKSECSSLFTPHSFMYTLVSIHSLRCTSITNCKLLNAEGWLKKCDKKKCSLVCRVHLVGEIIDRVVWRSTLLFTDASWILCQEGSCRCCSRLTAPQAHHCVEINLQLRTLTTLANFWHHEHWKLCCWKGSIESWDCLWRTLMNFPLSAEDWFKLYGMWTLDFFKPEQNLFFQSVGIKSRNDCCYCSAHQTGLRSK